MNLEVYADPVNKPRIAPLPEPASRVLSPDFANPHAPGRQLAMAGQGADQPNHLSRIVEKDAPGKDQELTFDDFLDIINPLHHIPVLSAAYREISGDTITPHARTLGGFLYTGPIGLVGGAVNGIVEEATGKDLGASFLALFRDNATSDPLPDAADAADETDVPAGTGFGGNDRIPPQSDPDEVAPLWSALPQRQSPPAPAGESVSTGPSDASERRIMTGDEALRAYLSDMSALSAAVNERTSEAVRKTPAAPEPDGPDSEQPTQTSKFYPLDGVVRGRTTPISPSSATHDSGDPASPRGGGPDVASRLDDGVSAETASAPPNGDEASMADRMMQALKKYEAMVRRRNGDSDASPI
jgi:hypothetical protein